MIYTDLSGQRVKGEVWSPGPKANTVWVLRPDGEPVVVKVGNKTVKTENPDGTTTKTSVKVRDQIEYEPPKYATPVPHNVKALAQEVVDSYRAAMNELRPLLGNTTPASPDYEIATAILRMAREFEQARLPFLDARGGNQPVSDARMKELRNE